MGADTNASPPASVFGRMQVGFEKLSARAYELVPQQQQQQGEQDLEAGTLSNNAPPAQEFGVALPHAWAGMQNLDWKGIAEQAKQQAASLSNNAAKQLDKAKENFNKSPQFESLNLANVFDPAKLEKIKDLGSSMSSTAKTAIDNAKGKATEAGAKTKEAAASAAAKTKQNVSSAAQMTKAKLGDAKGSIEALSMSREKLTQFLMLFLVGALICSIAFNYLPIIVIAPQKFALLFALGSGLMMASFSIVKGWKDFAEHLMQKSKLPFSAAYGLGMVGVLWASLLHPPFAYIWILVFSTMQVVGLTYFLVSYIPGGKRALTFIGRSCFNGIRKICKS